MGEVTPEDSIRSLHEVAASTPGRLMKQELLRLLKPGPGDTALDIGCGPGGDLETLAQRVTSSGRAIGVDRNPGHVRRGGPAHKGIPGVAVCLADAHALPILDQSVDRARAERVLMHVDDPSRVVEELRRVMTPRGRVVLAEPDWDTLVIDHPNPDLTRAVTLFLATSLIRNADIGRRLPRICVDAGFSLSLVTARTVVHRDFRSADAVWGLERVVAHMVDAGHLGPRTAPDWLHHLRSHEFLGAITIFVVAEAT
ncbi:hypothetical protein GCM10017581_038620 [Dactylosporangium matsuzakiense]|uniref:Methyltransferase domain-containing protein n=1 Tax=Dactylosporangium matsuzakiense TaxID=53360 RepID=A0A9W6KL19_9ACTN|nr:hypothetical protein GCM10017581_038620 [Dactylosporangium matsuzakiense]